MSLRCSDPIDVLANLKSTGGQICIFFMKKAAWAEEEEAEEGDGGTEFEKRLYLLLSPSCVLICYDTG